MGADRVRDQLALAHATRDVGADHSVGALDLVRERLADIVHERGSPRELLVEPELGRHHSCEVRGLDGMPPLVLRVARAKVERPDELHDLRMRLAHAERLEGALAERPQLLRHVLLRAGRPCLGVLAGLVERLGLLDDATERAAHQLLPHAVLAVEADRVLVVVDEKQDARRALERAVQRGAVVEQHPDQVRADAQVVLRALGEVVVQVAITGDLHHPLRLAIVRGVGRGLVHGPELGGCARARLVEPGAAEAVDQLGPAGARAGLELRAERLVALSGIALEARRAVAARLHVPLHRLDRLLALRDPILARGQLRLPARERIEPLIHRALLAEQCLVCRRAQLEGRAASARLHRPPGRRRLGLRCLHPDRRLRPCRRDRERALPLRLPRPRPAPHDSRHDERRQTGQQGKEHP